MASTASTAGSRILGNSFWYGLETILETVVTLATSIAVARYLGPDKLGHFVYINLFVIAANRTGASGLAVATRKYMSEYLAIERPGIARAVYHFTYRYQLLGALVITAIGIAGIARFGEPHYRLMASILILSIVPGAMSWVPAQANLAFEDLSQNTYSAVGYLISYAVIIVLTLHFQWDLVGIASASFVGRSVEALMRTFPLHARLRKLPLDALPSEIVHRIRRFCFEAMAMQALMMIVFERSELLFLHRYASYQQIAFYSVSFGLVNNLLLVPRTFGGATGVTLMVESGRDPKRVDNIVRNASRYLLLVIFPVHLGAIALTSQAIHFTYGAKYIGAIPVLMVAAFLGIPRGFQEIPETLLRAADRQSVLIRWYVITGILNLTLDAILIRRYGAVGAAWGNGLSQAFGVAAIWMQARRFYKFSLPLGSTLRLFVAASLMALSAYAIGRAVPGLPGFTLAIETAVPLYLLLVKLFHGLEFSDRLRLSPIGNRLPGAFRRAYSATIDFVTPAPM